MIKQSHEFTFIEQQMVNAAYFLEEAVCPYCTSALVPTLFSDINLEGLRIVQVVFASCCAQPESSAFVVYEDFMVAYVRSLFESRSKHD